MIAKVAVARNILTLCYYGLRRRDPLPHEAGPGERAEVMAPSQ
jgi:hypothetical protein